jgi:hypothetical protein
MSSTLVNDELQNREASSILVSSIGSRGRRNMAGIRLGLLLGGAER